MKNFLFFLGVFFAILNGCKKDEKFYDPYGVKTYAEFLDSLDLHCPDGQSSNYFEGLIKGQQTCYKDSIENYVFKFKLYSSVITDSPSLETGSSNSSQLYQIVLSFEPMRPRPRGKESISIKFPYYEPHRNIVEFLDSLFSIKYHKLKSICDGNKLQRSKTKFVVELLMVDAINNTGGGNGFLISTIYGKQNTSYVMIDNIQKTENNNNVFYTLDMKIECGLYYDPVNKKEGLWGNIEDGHVVVNFSVKK